MADRKRAAAKQQDGRGSTGPKSDLGKKRSSKNAMKHGMLSQDTVIPGEDPDAFEALWNEWMTRLKPVGPEEEILAETVVKAAWRLRRHLRLENAFLTRAQMDAKAEVEKRLREEVTSSILGEPPKFGEMSRRETDIYELGLMLDFKSTGPMMDTLSRYERANERRLFEALQRLQDLQAMRTEHDSKQDVIDVEE